MEFLGVGYQELIIVLVLALIFVGPERLPAIAYQIGRAVRELQRYARAVRDEFRDEFDYLEDQYKTIKGEIDTTKTALKDQERSLNRELKEATAPITEATKLTSPNGNGATNGSKAAPAASTDESEAAKQPPLVF
ncbi:MAG TPA: twin-arginine translocase TatA/TatE family subunit [Tepidiformaceae bacterium]|nr:twin-arginine translocase TatA/TatE family subunit [Tepidiformaceae bacterium]